MGLAGENHSPHDSFGPFVVNTASSQDYCQTPPRKSRKGRICPLSISLAAPIKTGLAPTALVLLPADRRGEGKEKKSGRGANPTIGKKRLRESRLGHLGSLPFCWYCLLPLVRQS
jgi:hypothetical protein